MSMKDSNYTKIGKLHNTNIEVNNSASNLLIYISFNGSDYYLKGFLRFFHTTFETKSLEIARNIVRSS